MEKLLVAVLGNRNSGKSKTWDSLFGTRVHTGKQQRALEVADSTFVEVFVVSGSPQERGLYVKDILARKRVRIVLCSIQYKDGYEEGARGTFDFFIKKGFSLYVQWLNPGRKDRSQYSDHLGLFAYIQHQHSVVSIRNGKYYPKGRVEELRQFIHGWATARHLTYQEK